MGRILFYLRYAARNLRRNGRWTTFAVFCIAAGVATVVALRTLGLAIGDSLVDNVRQNLHGDVRVSKTRLEGGFSAFNFGGNNEDNTFTDVEREVIREAAETYDATIAEYAQIPGIQITRVDAVTVGRPQFVSAYLIDPETFPPEQIIIAQDPAGVPLSDLFTGEGNEVVISRNLADQNQIAVGDTVRLSNTEEGFIVRGIVATEIEAGLYNIFASFFGFAYLDFASADTLQMETTPNIISILLPDGTSTDVATALADDIYRSRSTLTNLYFDTAPEWIERNEVIADYIGRFIVIMGLGALLIGGVGIINTMIVMVGRRTAEIAALKTFGLKGYQIFWLFMSEAFLLGVLGSIAGCIFGLILSVVVNQYGEAFLQQGLRWRLYPEALGYGLALGMVVTLVFGILPILTANKVRPATILRPNETVIPRAGVFHSLIAILLVVVVIGGIAGLIIGDIPGPRGVTISGPLIGIIGVGITLLILGVLVIVFWLIVWLVSKFPAFGIVDLRLALRNMTARRLRTATTLMALAAGMFALSAITFVGVGTREILNIQLSQNLGGNVLIFPLGSLISPTITNALLNTALDNIEGIEYTTRLENYTGVIETVDGVTPEINLPFNLDEDDFPQPRDGEGGNFPRGPGNAFNTIQIGSRITDNPNPFTNLIEGRGFTPDDEGERLIIIPENFNGLYSNVDTQLGSIIGVRVDGTLYEFEVIGIAPANNGFSFGASYVIPPESLSNVDESGIPFVIVQAEPENLNQVLLDLSALPLVFTIDITFIDSFLSRIIEQFAAIPTVVGLLSLLAAAVTMANTVSLSTLERRRQIGILKAVGLKGRRVLTIMLLENTLIGLLGGVLGIGVSALMVAALTALGVGEAIPIPRDAAPLAIALIASAVAIAWISTFLSSGVATREPVANVLRYE